MAFYNTTNLTGSDLKKAEAKTETQDEKILGLFVSCPGSEFTSWQVLDIVFPGTRVPVTSVGRSLDTLHKAGKIEKTTNKRMGPLGRECYTWRLKKEKQQLNLF